MQKTVEELRTGAVRSTERHADEVKSLASRIESANKASEAVRAENAKLQHQMESHKKEIATLQSALDTAQEALPQGSTSRSSTAEAQVTTMKLAVKELEDEVEELQAAVAQRQASADRYQVLAESAAADLESLTQNTEKMQAEHVRGRSRSQYVDDTQHTTCYALMREKLLMPPLRVCVCHARTPPACQG